MKCHYEILGLDEDCTSDDLKKAYRKLALEWHPDKNLSRLDEAKENFLLIQQAYEILSDPQERAWYDRHKDDILRGGAEEAYKDDCLDVYQYFNTGCFKGYNDDEKGFYTVYRQVFEKIAAEDKPFMDDDEDMEVPQFGYSYSSYEEVVHNFYAYWQSYCTAKSFSWVDKFDLTEARKSQAGRQVIRAMEKENRKLRDAHKKLRNEEVKELVAFVRKRDKRVQAQKKLMEEMKVEKAKIAEEKRRKQVQERNKAFEDYKETEWSSMSQFENHLNEIESALDATFGDNTNDTYENDEEVDDLGDLYCVACEKDFRSEKAFKNHENSKKHKDNVLLLRTLMEEEEADATSEADAGSEATTEQNENEETVPVESESEESITSEALMGELIKSSTKKSKKKKKKNKVASTNNEQIEETETLAEVELKIEDIQIIEETPNSAETKDAGSKTSIKSSSIKKKSKKIKAPKNETDLPEDNEDPTEKEETETLAEVELKIEDIQIIEETPNSAETNDAGSKTSIKSSIKKKSKKIKAPKNETDLPEDNEDPTEKPITLCGTCNKNFPSRNKLFEHIKQSGHAQYKSNDSTPGASGKKQRKKKL